MNLKHIIIFFKMLREL